MVVVFCPRLVAKAIDAFGKLPIRVGAPLMVMPKTGVKPIRSRSKAVGRVMAIRPRRIVSNGCGGRGGGFAAMHWANSSFFLEQARIDAEIPGDERVFFRWRRGLQLSLQVATFAFKL